MSELGDVQRFNLCSISSTRISDFFRKEFLSFGVVLSIELPLMDIYGEPELCHNRASSLREWRA